MATAPPLKDLRVLDTTDTWGELCGRVLAELGADVVRVEPPGGSESRRLAPMADGVSLFHAFRNLGKRSVVGDVADSFFAWADVWIDSSSTEHPTEILARHPHLVITSITPFGRDLSRVYRGWAATDSVIEAMSGMMFKAGIPEKPPLIPPSSLGNDVASCTAAFATLAACWQRNRTGYGQHIDLSVLAALAQTTDWSIPNASVMIANGLPVQEVRQGSGPYTIYKCKDGYVRLIILSPRQWRAMREWLGEPDYLQDDKYDAFFARMEIAPLLNQLYSDHFSTLTRDETSIEAQRRGIACTPVLRPEETLRNAHLLARRTFVELDVAPGLTAEVAAGFFEVDGERPRCLRDAPALGEHTEQFVAEAGVTASARVRPSGPPPMSALPLADLRVLDFGHGGVGVEAGRLMAEYGADVIKVESRRYPDFIRVIMGSEMSPSFASSSRSKRAFGVNAKDPEGLSVLYRLIGESDVIIENSSTGTMDDLGVGFDTVRGVNQGLVMVSSQLLGSHGPWADWIGYGPSTQPIGGLVHLWNYDDQEEPAGTTSIFPDHLAGRLSAVGALAGLLGRAGGQGCHVEVAQVEVVTGILGDLLLKAALDQKPVPAQGNRRDDGAPWGAYRCAGEQQWCVITVRDDDDWQRLRAALGEPEWAAAAELKTEPGRRAEHDRIDVHLTEWTSGLDKLEVARRLQAYGVPCGPVMTGTDLLKDPYLIELGFPVPIEQQDLGSITLEGPCFRATGMTGPKEEQAPRLGEHTVAICRDLLGLPEQEVERLVASGVLEVPAPERRPGD
jgi:crotonobetainyl-CoA:carnitine CoA-transferase CaiB-like acyl-CoA transferase